MDFLAAIIVVTAVVGGMLHFHELNQKAFLRATEYNSNSAEALAEYFVNNNATPPFQPACWCAVMRNATSVFYDDCREKECMRSCSTVFAATRLSRYCLNATCPCEGVSCALEVRTC